MGTSRATWSLGRAAATIACTMPNAYSYAGIVYCCTFMPLLLFFNGHLMYTGRGGEDY